MLLTLLVWIYITILSLVWGNIFLFTCKRLLKSDSVDIAPVIICFTGLATTGILTLYFSLFIPLGATVHLCLLIPAIVFLLFRNNRIILAIQLRQLVTSYSIGTACLLIAGICMLLAISSYTIIHPDTMAYHAQAIKWMETYKAVPGLVHMDMRLGFQSWWFGILSTTRFSFLYPNQFLFANGCVMAWFLVFIGQNLRYSTEHLKTLAGWILLLIFCLLSWTQIRLTAASANVDFVAALYVWAALYLFVNASHTNRTYYILSSFLAVAAISLKLSAIIIILLPFYCCYIFFGQRTPRSILFTLVCIAVTIAPVIIRNTIASGYPLYPAGFAGFSSADWKLSYTALTELQHYISASARSLAHTEHTEAVYRSSLSEWVPLWWKKTAITDKLLMLTFILFFANNLFSIKKQLATRKHTGLVMFLILLMGCFLWFYKAPDPRFGTTFLIPLIWLSGKDFFESIPGMLRQSKKIFTVAVFCLSGIITCYTIYRLYNFSNTRQFLLPTGIPKVPYNTFTCQGATMYQTLNPEECGLSPVPCIKDSCNTFQLRGSDMEEGFRAAATKH